MKNQKSPFWLKNFEREIGVTEVPGPEDNPRILEYFKSLYPNFEQANWHDSDSWCAVSLNFIFEQSGIEGTNSPAAIDFLKWGRSLKKPRKGCVAVLWRVDPSGWESHVGLVVDEKPDEILLLGGNQDDAVSLKWFTKNKVRKNGYRWPIVTDINSAIKRRGHIKGGDKLVGKQKENQIEIKVPWYKRLDWKLIIKTVISAAGAFLQGVPKLVVVGNVLLQWSEKIDGKKKSGLEKLIEIIIEFFKALVKRLKK